MSAHDPTAPRPDSFTGHPTRLHEGTRDGPGLVSSLLDDLRRGLEAFDGLRRAAQEGGFAGVEESAFFAGLAEIQPNLRPGKAEVKEGQRVGKVPSPSSGRDLRGAADRFLRAIPRIELSQLGFDPTSPNPLEDSNLYLRRIGGGVEAWAFADVSSPQGWIYKFFMPRHTGGIAATFRIQGRADEGWTATSAAGTYSDVIWKLILINSIGGMPTELCGLTPEGVIVVKQWPGKVMAEDAPTSHLLPPNLIPLPSRFLTADRDHPRLFFYEDTPWLVADTHSKNVVLDARLQPRIIDLVAAPLIGVANSDKLWADWIRRVRVNPKAGVMAETADEDY